MEKCSCLRFGIVQCNLCQHYCCNYCWRLCTNCSKRFCSDCFEMVVREYEFPSKKVVFYFCTEECAHIFDGNNENFNP